MSTATVTHPHTVRATIAKAGIATILTAGALVGVYAATHTIGQHVTRPATTHAVSYADRATIDATLAGAWHIPATAGDFRPAASISGGNVVSAVVVVP